MTTATAACRLYHLSNVGPYHRPIHQTRVPWYPGLKAVKPENPGLKNTLRVCIPYSLSLSSIHGNLPTASVDNNVRHLPRTRLTNVKINHLQTRNINKLAFKTNTFTQETIFNIQQNPHNFQNTGFSFPNQLRQRTTAASARTFG